MCTLMGTRIHTIIFFLFFFKFKPQPDKTVKYTQTIRRLLLTRLWGWGLKGLARITALSQQPEFSHLGNQMRVKNK